MKISLAVMVKVGSLCIIECIMYSVQPGNSISALFRSFLLKSSIELDCLKSAKITPKYQ